MRALFGIRPLLLTASLWSVGASCAQTAPPPTLTLPASAEVLTDPGPLRAAAAQLSGLARASGLPGPCQDSHLARVVQGQGSGLDPIEHGFARSGYVMAELTLGGDNQLAFTLTRNGVISIQYYTIQNQSALVMQMEDRT